MKKCTSCNTFKNLTDFYKQNDRKNGHSSCKECFNKYCAERWRQKKLDAVSYLGGVCKHCGFDTHPAALHFHHKNPSEKVANWNKMRLWTWERTKKELNKCEILCANCHAIHHSSS